MSHSAPTKASSFASHQRIEASDGDIDNFDKTRSMLEAVCDSIKANS